MIQNKALRIATEYHQKAAASHLRAETGALPLRAHLELRSQQFYASALQPLHPSYLIITSPPRPRLLTATLQASYHRYLRSLRVRGDDPNAPTLIFDWDHPVPGTQQGACSNCNKLNNINFPFCLEAVECEHLHFCWQAVILISYDHVKETWFHCLNCLVYYQGITHSLASLRVTSY